jgi:hypothetical protein
MSDAPDFMQGCSITTGVVRRRDLGYVICTMDKYVADDIPHSRIFSRLRGQWGGVTVEWTVCSGTICLMPSERFLTLGAEGETWVVGGGQSALEGIVRDGNLRPETRGPMREIRGIVGGHAYAVGTCRQAYRRQAPGRWTCIDHTAQTPVDDIADTSFESIDGFSEQEIYAVGWEGEIWQYDGAAWVQRASPTNLALYKVRCASDGFAYACGQNGLLLRGRGDRWTVIDHDATEEDLWGMEWFGGKLFVSSTSFVYELSGGLLNLVDFGDEAPETCYHLSAADGIMWSIGAKDVVEFDGTDWSRILAL